MECFGLVTEVEVADEVDVEEMGAGDGSVGEGVKPRFSVAASERLRVAELVMVAGFLTGVKIIFAAGFDDR